MPVAKNPPPIRVGNIADADYRDSTNQDPPRKEREPDPKPVGLTPADKGFQDFTVGVPDWVKKNMAIQGGIPAALRDDKPEERLPPAPGYRECRHVVDGCTWTGKRGNDYKQHLRTAHDENRYQTENLEKARAARKAKKKEREQDAKADLEQHKD